MKNFIKTSLIIPKLCPFSLVRWFFVSFSLLQSEGQPGQLDLNQSWLGFYLWPERASPEVCYVGPGELSELWWEVHLEQDSLTSYKQKWWCINQRTLARKALVCFSFAVCSPASSGGSLLLCVSVFYFIVIFLWHFSDWPCSFCFAW